MSEQTPKKGHKPKSDHPWLRKNKLSILKTKLRKLGQFDSDNNLWLYKENGQDDLLKTNLEN